MYSIGTISIRSLICPLSWDQKAFLTDWLVPVWMVTENLWAFRTDWEVSTVSLLCEQLYSHQAVSEKIKSLYLKLSQLYFFVGDWDQRADKASRSAAELQISSRTQ